MAEPEIKVEIRSIEAIRPSSRTPKHLRIFKLSMLDQISPDLYVPLILFYPLTTKKSSLQTHLVGNPNERAQRLRETLAKALTLHYPLAGRLRHNLFVECTDHGAVFVEAVATCPMSRVLGNPPDSIGLKSFVPARPESGLDSHGGSLLLVQVTIFDCGGISLGLSFSHKIADAFTIATFLKNWTKIEKETLEEPVFGGVRDLFPSILNPLAIERSSDDNEFPCEKSAVRRFVFTAEKVRALKRVISIRYPTRVEAISSLIWKCATKSSLISGSRSPSSTWFTAMDMRKVIVPPFRANVVGNLLTGFSTTKTIEEEDEEAGGFHLQVFAEKLRNGIEEARAKYTKKERIWKSVMGVLLEMEREANRGDFYSCASWCGFGLYGLDFGWGNPVWVSLVCSEESENLVVLMDSRDGVGIEAWLVFKEERMASIESDQELLSFSSINPCVV